MSASRGDRVLLPSDVVPEKYDLTLEPDLEQSTFEGTVKITVDVQVATETVMLHAKELVISSAKFTASGSKSAMKADEISLKIKDTTVTLGFIDVLPVGKGELEISFRGILNDQMAGFYRSQYTDSKGVKRYMATTQFEAIDARRCFPCWDEPARKAVFEVTMIFPANLTSIANMPQSRAETRQDGKRVETYMPTPKMSTYLLAFCVGEFEFISGQSKHGTIARIFACPGNIPRCEFALKCCTKALDFYNDFFEIPYPLPKVDMIAIPDFSAGAMENWGLITYREVALLCDESTVSATQKQRICSVIAHELAHQWFGNLVTMQWWDDLWLNEGFANWMQTFCSDKLFPEWQLWEAYVGMEQQRALQLDALRSSHPIQVPIKKAEEVEEVFDAISYCKGGSVVRMIYAVLGEKHFQDGLKLYFKRHQYGNTETTDLWRAWSEVSGKPIDVMMSSWTEQMGFPVLKILNDPLSTDEVELQQSWFLADGSTMAGDESKTWFCPILIGSDKAQAPVSFLEPSSKTGKISCGGISKNAAWLKVNFGQHVPVRVLYPESMLSQFAAGIANVPAEDRIGLLSDAFALCKAGLQDATSLVKLLQGFRQEENDKVWSELSTVLAGLHKVILQGLEPEVAEAFVQFAGKLVSPAFQKIGWEGTAADDDNRKLLRNVLVSTLSKFCYKDPTVVGEAMKKFKAFVAAPNDSSVLSADIRPAVLAIAIQQGSEEVFNQTIAAHDAVSDGAVRNHIYAALGKCPTPELRRKALEMCLTDKVRSQDLYHIPMSMAVSGREAADDVFTWIQSSYTEIYGRIGTGSMMLFQHFVRISGAGFVTTEQAAKVEGFWRSKLADLPSIEKAISQTVEGIMSSAKFVERLKASEAAKVGCWSTATSRL
eukprot:TRINITY_DN9895_c0_g1_i3.p1 TRINITY_DN9895_c0_g1~~TRINITY_DN9895_c0_g1_i3.p1  ORF type:complete len:886 (-),score=194.02 TRINITY_DN9895_c0_g1_i3:264-2921(-)